MSWMNVSIRFTPSTVNCMNSFASASSCPCSVREQLRVGLHHPQRLLQFVGYDESEAPELLVGTDQRLLRFLQRSRARTVAISTAGSTGSRR